MDLTGKVALVSGGAQGIGFAIAQKLISVGATAYIADINPETGAKASAELGDQGHFIQLNVAEEAGWQNAFAQITADHAQVDILVNCAGITGGSADVEHETMDDWQKVLAVNATGTFLGVKYAMAQMTKGGAIVNVASMAGMYAEPVAVAYSASKGAARLITKHAALYGAQKTPQVRVNSVLPGSTNTPMVQQISELQPEVMAAQRNKVPLKRFAEPADIADMVAFLASDDASYVTGGDFKVDGGISAGF